MSQTSLCLHYKNIQQQNICKIWGFHEGASEECRLLGYTNPVCTSHKTHYVSATEPSRLRLCKIGGFNGGDYEECRLMECDDMWRFKNRRLEEMYRFQGEKNQRAMLLYLRSVLQLLVTSNTVPSSLILWSLVIESIPSSETSVLTRATWRHIPGDAILQQNIWQLKSISFIFNIYIYIYIYICLIIGRE
jgi:hypothetical protein